MHSPKSLTAAKKLVRNELRLKLQSLSPDLKISESKVITQKLTNSTVFKNSRSLSVYLSMPTEVSTDDILHSIFESKKKCYIPYYIGDEMKMVLLKDRADYDSLPYTSWNIKQPSDEEERENAIESGGLDLIIVPGLAFAQDGRRLGRGKGYYDNYFRKYEKALQKRPYLIGLAYSCQILTSVPADDYDVTLDEVLTV